MVDSIPPGHVAHWPVRIRHVHRLQCRLARITRASQYAVRFSSLVQCGGWPPPHVLVVWEFQLFDIFLQLVGRTNLHSEVQGIQAARPLFELWLQGAPVRLRWSILSERQCVSSPPSLSCSCSFTLRMLCHSTLRSLATSCRWEWQALEGRLQASVRQLTMEPVTVSYMSQWLSHTKRSRRR